MNFRNYSLCFTALMLLTSFSAQALVYNKRLTIFPRRVWVENKTDKHVFYENFPLPSTILPLIMDQLIILPFLQPAQPRRGGEKAEIRPGVENTFLLTLIFDKGFW